MKSLPRMLLCYFILFCRLWAEPAWTVVNPYPQGNTLYGLSAWDGKRMTAVDTGGTLLATHDGGRTWKIAHPLPWFLGSWYAVAWIDDQIGLLFGAAGRILRRGEEGRWIPMASGVDADLLDGAMGKEGIGVAIGTEGVILRTEDGGITWGRMEPATSEWPYSICQAPHGEFWCVGGSGTILHSTERGKHWRRIRSDIHQSLYRVLFISPDCGWIAGQDGLVLFTKDGGNTWQPRDTGTRWSIYDLCLIDAQNGWTAGENGTLLRTRDAGESWQAVYSGTSRKITRLIFTHPDTGWAVGGNGLLLSTHDGGSTWQSLHRGETTWLKGLCFVDASVGWTVGREGLLLKTEDGGNTWLRQTSHTWKHLEAISFGSPTRGWAVGRQHVMLSTKDGGKTWNAINYLKKPDLHGVFFFWMIALDGSSGTVGRSTVPGMEGKNGSPGNRAASQKTSRPSGS